MSFRTILGGLWQSLASELLSRPVQVAFKAQKVRSSSFGLLGCDSLGGLKMRRLKKLGWVKLFARKSSDPHPVPELRSAGTSSQISTSNQPITTIASRRQRPQPPPCRLPSSAQAPSSASPLRKSPLASSPPPQPSPLPLHATQQPPPIALAPS